MTIPSPLAVVPPPNTPVPDAVLRILDSHQFRSAHLQPAWLNGVGGLTFAIASGGRGHPIDFYAKWNPINSGESLADEAARLQWIQGRHPAPTVFDLVTNENEELLLTHALPGESAIADQWKRDPETALRALGSGLRQLHAISLDDCPFDWGMESRLRAADLVPETIAPPPSIDRLVLCQGDPCVPNTLVAEDGSFLAHVDLARLGAADRWADLAVMTMSMEWNYRDYDESIFWEAYGVEPDPVRIDYYRWLWNLT